MSKKRTIKDMLEGVAQRNEPIPSGYTFDPRMKEPLSRRHRKPAEEAANALGIVDVGDQPEAKPVDVENSSSQDDAKVNQDGDK